MAENGNLLDEMAHWTGVIGRMQQLLMEHGATAALKMVDDTAEILAKNQFDPGEMVAAQTAWWKEAMASWQAMLPQTPEMVPTGRTSPSSTARDGRTNRSHRSVMARTGIQKKTDRRRGRSGATAARTCQSPC